MAAEQADTLRADTFRADEPHAGESEREGSQLADDDAQADGAGPDSSGPDSSGPDSSGLDSSGPGTQQSRERLAREIAALLLGSEPSLDRNQAAEKSGVPLEEARRVWRAMGFADVGEAVAFTTSDIDAFGHLMGLVSSEKLDDRTALELVRSLGRTTARLADWQVEVLGRHIAARHRDDLDDDVILSDIEALLPAVESMLVHVWRRQLAASISRTLAGLPDEEEFLIETVGFADIVGFTRLSRRVSPDALAALVEDFESASADIIASYGGRVVKTVGDEVMFVCSAPLTAASIAAELHRASLEDTHEFQLRIGLATGPVVSKMGDVYGSCVNLAARLTALARPGGTLADQATADGLPRKSGFDRRTMGPRPVRGFGLIRPVVLTRRPTG